MHPIPSGALQIIEKLRSGGHQALLVGGCVRDWLMGRRPVDWDVATDADPAVVRGLFERVVPVGAQFGVTLVLLDDGAYEVSRFRRDGTYLDGRHPTTVDFADAVADAQRRDFTINGMFYDPVSGQTIDHVGGRQDIAAGLIRAIGRPQQRFAEDHLRMLRAVRFAARLQFSIEPETFAAIGAGAGNILKVSWERIRDELTAILTQGRAAAGMQMLLDAGLLVHILPEVAAMEGVPQPPEFHPEGDVWTHVKLLLDDLDRPSATLAWGALLHDIGKPKTMRRSDRIRFNGHDAAGAEMAADICRRLRMSNRETDRIVQLTAQHMRIGDARQMRPSKLKRMLRQPLFPELLELHRLDCLASHRKLDVHAFCREQLAAADDSLRPKPLLTGTDLIGMGYAPGACFREMLASLEDAQLEGRVADREQAIAFVRERFPR